LPTLQFGEFLSACLAERLERILGHGLRQLPQI